MVDVILKINKGAFIGAKRAGFQSAEAMAMQVKAEAKQLAPVNKGTLRNSVDIEPGGSDSYFVGSDVHYAPYVEMGTVRMKAQPYLRPAADLAQLTDVRAITNKIMKERMATGGVEVYRYK